MGEIRIFRRDSLPETGKRGVTSGAAGFAVCLILFACRAPAQIIPDSLIRAILEEVSAGNALEETAAIAGRFRYPNSQGFFDAAEHVASRARKYGLTNVRIERFPADRPMWDPVEASLDIVAPEPQVVSNLQMEPLLLAQWSHDGDVSAELADAAGDVKDKIALTTQSPQIAWKTLSRRGAKAMLCAWQPDYFGRRPSREAVAWGEAPSNAFAFMISPRQGDALRDRLKRGPLTIRMRARIRRTEPGEIGQVMGEIPGQVPGQDVVLVAHLDHQKQGANDNASGSGTLLEVLRVANRMIAAGTIPKPLRTLRFWWSTEIRSEKEYFKRHPGEAKKISLAVVLDQAGGDRRAVNNFIMIANPDWRPSYADDLIYDLADFFARQYSPAEHEPSPLAIAEGGSTQAMRNVYFDYQPLSDHVSFVEKGIDIPAIALAVPSLDVIHTDQDTVDRLDPTWLKRSAMMTLAPALFTASAGPKEARALLEATFRRAVTRLAEAGDPDEQLKIERRRLESLTTLDHGIDLADYRARLAAIAKALKTQTR